MEFNDTRMKLTPDVDRVANAHLQRPAGVILKGQFTEVLRSPKGKIKGIQLRSDSETYAIKLPKYLRPMLVRELAPGAFVQVWAYFEEEKWRGINLLPLSECEAIALRETWQSLEVPVEDVATTTDISTAETNETAPPAKKLCVQVCRKGKCFKQGGRQIVQSLEGAIAADPSLQHISVEGVGCLKACKKGPNLKLSNSKRVISGVTPENALALITQHS